MSEEITAELSNDEKAALLDAQLSPETPTIAAAPEVAPVVPEVAPVEPPAKVEGEDDASGRFRLSGKPAAFAQLVKEGVPEAEAIQRIYGNVPAAESAATQEQQEQDDDGPTDALSEQRAELADIETQIAAAAEDQSLFTPELKELMERATDLKLEIKLGEKDIKAQEIEQEKSADASFDAEYDRNEAQALAEYPDAANLETPLGKLAQKLAKAAAFDPDLPKGDTTIGARVIAEAAEMLGIKPVSAQQQAGSQQQQQQQASTPAKAPVMAPVSGGERTVPSVVPNGATEKAALATRLAQASTPAEKAAILDEGIYGNVASMVPGITMA